MLIFSILRAVRAYSSRNEAERGNDFGGKFSWPEGFASRLPLPAALLWTEIVWRITLSGDPNEMLGEHP
jgi:hypothetical protein